MTAERPAAYARRPPLTRLLVRPRSIFSSSVNTFSSSAGPLGFGNGRRRNFSRPNFSDACPLSSESAGPSSENRAAWSRRAELLRPRTTGYGDFARSEFVGVVRVTLTTRVMTPELGECFSSACANETTGSAAVVRITPEMALDFVVARRCREGDWRAERGGVFQARTDVGGDSDSLNWTWGDTGVWKDCVKDVVEEKDCWNAAVRRCTES